MSDDPSKNRSHSGKDDLDKRVYPEDERLRSLQEDPDRRMTREEWEREESQARQAAHKKHERVKHDREVQEEFDRKQRSRHRNWKKILLWVGAGILVLLLIFIAGYIPRHEREKKAAAAAKQREQEKPEVEVVKVTRTRAPGELTVPGTTASLTEAFIYARANGYLQRRLVDIGDRVKKGQLLGVIEAPDLDQEVDQAREQLRQAEAQVSQQEAQLNLSRVTWERWKILVAKGVFSRQDGDQREADYRAQSAVYTSAERNVRSFRANLNRVLALQSYERITAPFDGIITQRNSDVGALVQTTGAAASAPSGSAQSSSGGSSSVGVSNTSGTSGTQNQSATPSTGEAQGGPIFAIARIDKLRILVSVPEGYASDVRKGMPARVFVQERPGKPIAGTVTRTADALDQNSRTMLTEVDVDNKDDSLYPGMYSVVTFVQIRGESPLVVPGDAVIVRQDRTSLAVVRDSKIQVVPVQIGRDYGPSVEILSGIKEGDLVVSTVTDQVREGVEVRTTENQSQEKNASGGSEAQTSAAPDAGPDQYGDQSIVNAPSGNTNAQGKPGQPKGQQQGKQNQSGKQHQKEKKQQEKLEKKGSGQ